MKNISSAALCLAAFATAARTAESQSPVPLVASSASSAVVSASAPVAESRTKSRFETAQSAMVAAGRRHPSDAETLRAAAAMERGVTRSQIQAITRCADDDRSLVVAFEVLASLRANGMPAARAAAKIQANITSGASDAVLSELVGASSRKP